MAPSIALPTLYREALTSFTTGKSPDSVVNLLVQKGLPEPYARTLMTEALNAKRTRCRKEGLIVMLKGSAFIAAGVVVAALTFHMPVPVYAVAAAPIVYGGVHFF